MGVHPGSFPYEVAVPGKQRNRNFLQQRRRPNGSKIKTIYRLTVVANFVAITQSLLENVKWRWISLELNYSGPNPSFGGKRKIRGRVFTCSIKRRIRELHVVVVHWRQGNEQKCDAVLLIKSFSSVFLAFTLPSPSSTLKLPKVEPGTTERQIQLDF